ncbi:MAG TPA: PQQ-binding-like beta-propeller repeat protein [Planctomycetaceae bacterium]|jgi:outer membrane protein assembly factor BamB|nr:PQQ-binding-like beta-propeller repeat protein [Planctomycetaceae bacterium]
MGARCRKILGRTIVRSWLVVLAIVLCGATAEAGDWPQILGPHRDGRAEGESLADSWPAAGPKVVWERPVGRGYAGVAVVGERGVLFHRVENEELVQAFDVRTGKFSWKFAIPTSYVSGISPDDGPRCVPVIQGDRVIAFGAQGNLACVRLTDGAKIWTVDTHAEFRAGEGYFGAGSSPIVEGDKVIVNVGGAKSDAGIVAFSLESGQLVWKATREDASYSSPVAVTVHGVRHLIVETRLKTISLNPDNGAIRFEVPFGMRGPTVNGANPTVFGDRLFMTASYGIGAVFAKIGDTSAEKLWDSNDLISSQYATCIAEGGLLYGIHGRDDQGQASLRCIDPEKQKILWQKDDFGYATLLFADGKLIVQKTDGTFVLVKASPSQYTELATAQIFNTKTFALPALASGRLYVRDDRTLKCLDLRR